LKKTVAFLFDEKIGRVELCKEPPKNKKILETEIQYKNKSFKTMMLHDFQLKNQKLKEYFA